MYNELQWTIMSHLAAIAEMAVTGFFLCRAYKAVSAK